MIRNKNSGKPIANGQFTGGFDWDIANRRIVTTQGQLIYPYPRNFDFSTLSYICALQKFRKAYEDYLKLYFTENIGLDANLDTIVGNNPVWFGNEVACGVGMQKIDILPICISNNEREYRAIEIKDEAVDASVVEQISYYVNWASQNSGRHLDGAFNTAYNRGTTS